MCGIAGVVNFDKIPVDKGLIEQMVSIQRYRGPDDSGIYINKNIGLGHARLAIIDLSKDASQPMANEDSTAFIVHNGEIYNHLELRDELKRLGHSFRSKSDTEVILHAYEEWGEECLSRFNGMWAFAILDLNKNELFCARDRFGVKPFYYYADGDVFVFGSEIKSILKHPRVEKEPNDTAVFNYLSSGYGYMDVSNETFFKGIKQLKPSHYLKLSTQDRRMSETKYWDLDPRRKVGLTCDKDVYKRFYEIFEDSVRLRLRSDVPLGISLSGGLDSSSIACVAAGILKGEKIESFSSCFEDERYDERKFIKPLLDKTGIRANFIFTKPDNLFDEIEDIVWHQDEPYSSLSIFPQWYVMKFARGKGVKVLLTGQGGDEVLGGYHKYFFYLFADLIRSMRWQEAQREIKMFRAVAGRPENVALPVSKIMMSYMTPVFLKRALRSNAVQKAPDYLRPDFAKAHSGNMCVERKFASILNNDLYNALKISPLPSLLHIDDRSSMAHSVESRAPFLDYRLVEYLFTLGPEYKIRNGATKYVLREALRGVLPEEIRTRTDKMGFATPLEQWFKTILKDKVRDIITSSEFLNRGYFEKDAVLKKFDDFLNNRDPGAHLTIWSWVNLELWFRKFMVQK